MLGNIIRPINKEIAFHQPARDVRKKFENCVTLPITPMDVVIQARIGS
jgi:hypothetical protein